MKIWCLFAFVVGCHSIKPRETLSCSFVSWPHRKVFDGLLGEGYWLANRSAHAWKNKVEFSSGLIPHHAFLEGVYLPKSGLKYRLFSAGEARQCLQGKSLFVIGDSYMKSAYIGLAEILLDRPSKVEMRSGGEREDERIELGEELRIGFKEQFTVEFVFDECRHEGLQSYFQPMAELVKERHVDGILMHVLIHHIHAFQHNESIDVSKDYMTKVKGIFAQFRKYITWATGPSYSLKKIPKDYAESMRASNSLTESLNFQVLQLGKQMKIPILDYFSVTAACRWENCSADGGHRARFVNRIKAQMWLNNLCDCE